MTFCGFNCCCFVMNDILLKGDTEEGCTAMSCGLVSSGYCRGCSRSGGSFAFLFLCFLGGGSSSSECSSMGSGYYLVVGFQAQ